MAKREKWMQKVLIILLACLACSACIPEKKAYQHCDLNSLTLPVMQNNLAAVKIAYQANPNLLDQRDNCGRTPLNHVTEKLAEHWLRKEATAEDETLLRYLLEAQANPNVANSMGSFPLGAIAVTGKVDLLRLLVLSGADPLVGAIQDAPLRCITSTVELAKLHGHQDAANYLATTIASTGIKPNGIFCSSISDNAK